MRVTLVYRAVESLGLENLSATLKRAGHEVTLAFAPDLFGPLHRRRAVAGAVLPRVPPGPAAGAL